MASKVESIDAAKEKLSETVQAAKDKAKEVKQVAEEKYQKVAAEMRREAEKAQKAARAKVDVAKEQYDVAAVRLKDGYSRVQKDMGELTDDVNEYVRDNPGRSVLIAALIGFFLGLILRPGRD
ncbi:MAG: hypothetical protein K8J08_14380 [Thermoanaerobaculia bacterium]|nr:hypothetical protein [Thermoanaerobaculia bacterium]